MLKDEDGEPVEAIADLSGLSRTRPLLALCLAIVDVQPRRYPAAVRLLGQVRGVPGRGRGRATSRSPRSVSRPSVIGAFYYIKIVKVMYFDEPADRVAAARATGRTGHYC